MPSNCIYLLLFVACVCVCVYVCVCMCARVRVRGHADVHASSEYVEVEGQLCGVISLFPPCVDSRAQTQVSAFLTDTSPR